jgi:hypothetical protein
VKLSGKCDGAWNSRVAGGWVLEGRSAAARAPGPDEPDEPALGMEAVAVGRWSLHRGPRPLDESNLLPAVAASRHVPGKFSHRTQAEARFPATALLERTTRWQSPAPIPAIRVPRPSEKNEWYCFIIR